MEFTNEKIRNLHTCIEELAQGIQDIPELKELDKDISNEEVMQKVTELYDFIYECMEDINKAFDEVENAHYKEWCVKTPDEDEGI